MDLENEDNDKTLALAMVQFEGLMFYFFNWCKICYQPPCSLFFVPSFLGWSGDSIWRSSCFMTIAINDYGFDQKKRRAMKRRGREPRWTWFALYWNDDSNLVRRSRSKEMPWDLCWTQREPSARIDMSLKKEQIYFFLDYKRLVSDSYRRSITST